MNNDLNSVESVRAECIAIENGPKLSGPSAINTEITLRTKPFQSLLERESRNGAKSHECCVVMTYLGESLARAEAYEEAIEVLQKSISNFVDLDLFGCSDFVKSVNTLIDVGFASENNELVESIFIEHLNSSKRWRAESKRARFQFWLRYHEYQLHVLDNFEAAVDAYSRVYESAADVWGEGHPQHFVCGKIFCELLAENGDVELAVKVGEETIEVGRNSPYRDGQGDEAIAELKAFVDHLRR